MRRGLDLHLNQEKEPLSGCLQQKKGALYMDCCWPGTATLMPLGSRATEEGAAGLDLERGGKENVGEGTERGIKTKE